MGLQLTHGSIKDAAPSPVHTWTLLVNPVPQVLARMRSMRSLAEFQKVAGQLQRMCAAMPNSTLCSNFRIARDGADRAGDADRICVPSGV